MSFSAVTARGTVSERNADNAIAGSPSAEIATGKAVFVVVCGDNISTVDGASTDHTVTDTDGHTWERAFEETLSPGGAADDGVTVSVFMTVATAAIGTGDTITCTFGGTITAKTMHFFEATKGAGTTLEVQAVAHDREAGGAVLSGMPSREYLLIGVAGRENEDTAADVDADYTAIADTISSTTGATTSNVALHSSYRVATLTEDTYLPGSLGVGDDLASVVAIYEGTAGTPGSVAPGVIARSFTLGAPTIKGGAVVAPTVMARAFTIPQATASAGGTPGSVTPDAIARAFTVNAPTVKGAAVAAPNAVALSVTVPSVTVKGGAVASPATIQVAFTIPQASAFGGGAGQVTPAAIARAVTLPAPTIKGGGVVTPGVIARAVDVLTASAKGAAEAAPSVISASVTVPAVTLKTGATITPGTITRSFTLPGVTVAGAAEVAPGVIVLVVTIPQASGAATGGSGTYQEGGLIVVLQSGSLDGGQLSGGLTGGSQG